MVNGLQERSMDMEFCISRMDKLHMKETGKTINLMEKEWFSLRNHIYFKKTKKNMQLTS